MARRRLPGDANRRASNPAQLRRELVARAAPRPYAEGAITVFVPPTAGLAAGSVLTQALGSTGRPPSGDPQAAQRAAFDTQPEVLAKGWPPPPRPPRPPPTTLLFRIPTLAPCPLRPQHSALYPPLSPAPPDNPRPRPLPSSSHPSPSSPRLPAPYRFSRSDSRSESSGGSGGGDRNRVSGGATVHAGSAATLTEEGKITPRKGKKKCGTPGLKHRRDSFPSCLRRKEHGAHHSHNHSPLPGQSSFPSHPRTFRHPPRPHHPLEIRWLAVNARSTPASQNTRAESQRPSAPRKFCASHRRPP